LFYGLFFRDDLGGLVSEESFFWTFMVQGKITEAESPTIRLGATLFGLISDPPPSSPIFTLDALPAATLLLYSGLGQPPNMLACIPSGVVNECKNKYYSSSSSSSSSSGYFSAVLLN